MFVIFCSTIADASFPHKWNVVFSLNRLKSRPLERFSLDEIQSERAVERVCLVEFSRRSAFHFQNPSKSNEHEKSEQESEEERKRASCSRFVDDTKENVVTVSMHRMHRTHMHAHNCRNQWTMDFSFCSSLHSFFGCTFVRALYFRVSFAVRLFHVVFIFDAHSWAPFNTLARRLHWCVRRWFAFISIYWECVLRYV